MTDRNQQTTHETGGENEPPKTEGKRERYNEIVGNTKEKLRGKIIEKIRNGSDQEAQEALDHLILFRELLDDAIGIKTKGVLEPTQDGLNKLGGIYGIEMFSAEEVRELAQ